MLVKPQTARELLDSQWKTTVRVANGLKPHSLSMEYEETHLLLNLLDRKLKAIISIGDVIHMRGDSHTVWNFEGVLLGGLNDHQIDVDFLTSPITFLNVSNSVMQRLLLIRRLLKLAEEYFKLATNKHPLYSSFMEEIYPYYTDWLDVQSLNLSQY